MKARRSLITYGLVTLTVVLIGTATTTCQAQGLLPAAFVLTNLKGNDQVPREVLGSTPSYNVYLPNGDPLFETYYDKKWCDKKSEVLYRVTGLGTFLGGNPRANSIVATVPQNGIMFVDPGITNRAKLVGVIATSNNPSFYPQGIRVFPDGKNLPKFVEPKFLIPIDLSTLATGLYDVKSRAVFRQAKYGPFNLWKSGYDETDCTHIYFIVQSMEEWRRTVNDPAVQAALRSTKGLVGGPTEVGAEPKVEINDPELVKQLQDGSIAFRPIGDSDEPTMKASSTTEEQKPAQKNNEPKKHKVVEQKKSSIEEDPADPPQADPEMDPTIGEPDPLSLRSDCDDPVTLDMTHKMLTVKFIGREKVRSINFKIVDQDGTKIWSKTCPTPKHCWGLNLMRKPKPTADGLTIGKSYTVKAWASDAKGKAGPAIVTSVVVN